MNPNTLRGASPPNLFIGITRSCVPANRRDPRTGFRGPPGIRGRIVTPSRLELAHTVRSTPDDHLAAGPDGAVPGAWRRNVRARARRLPGVIERIVATAVGAVRGVISPDDHLPAGPHGSMVAAR